MTFYLFSLFICFSASYGLDLNYEDFKPDSSPGTQKNEVLNLIKRIIPDRAHNFQVEVDPSLGPSGKDTFKVEKTDNETVIIFGSSGVAAATGIHHYLKYYCLCHISWNENNLNLPQILPEVNITVTSMDRFRYYQNVCAPSYSFVWWDWNQWEKHIDWMVLNSFNLVLAFNGQEAIWKRIYKKLNLTEAEIDEHFGGPAFLSWTRMGNIRGWGGPLSDAWHTRSLMLQHKILKRFRNFGVTPVLPAFAGSVPRAFKRLFPSSELSTTPPWNSFKESYCCQYILEPTDPLFQTVGSMYISELTAEFGTNHAYNCDTFNENLPTNASFEYINKMGAAVYSAIQSVDPKAIWIMQGWLFVHDFLFWTEKRAEALLTSVPKGKMIVLDLQSEQWPQYERLNSFFGQPYIWCMLHNFGGTLGMLGSIHIINNRVPYARSMQNSTMIGTGLTPEGINPNYVVYDLMNEMGWRSQPVNLTEWLEDYAIRRYGKSDSSVFAAWKLLKDTVYSFSGVEKMRGKYTINRRPSLRIQPWSWYNKCDFMEAWSLFLSSSDRLGDSKAYQHDLVDITRQALQILGDQYYIKLIKDFRDSQLSEFWNASASFLEILRDLEDILKTNDAFLLGRWLNDAKRAANNSEEEILFEYNARNQITLWGPNGEIVDYANKQWSGIASQLFVPRWTLFLNAMNESLITCIRFNESETIGRVFEEVEEPFTFDRSNFSIHAIGDTIKTAQSIHEKWRSKASCVSKKTDFVTIRITCWNFGL